MINNIKKFINFIRHIILKKFFFKKDIYFYKGNGLYSLGSLNFLRNLFLNIMYPGRFFFKVRYKQVFKKDSNSLKYFERKIKVLSNYYLEYFSKNKIDQLYYYLEKINKDGAFIVEEYFSKNQIDLIKKKYSEEIKVLENNNKTNEIAYNYHYLKMDNLTKSFFYDPGIILLIESFYQREIFARNYPVINHTSVPKIINENTISKTADNWHVDHTNLGSLFVLLEDVPINGTRMQYLPGTHKYHNIAGHHSNEQYKKKKKGECFGKQGTVHFHSGNIVHRAKINPGYNRWSLNFEYSIGSNILLNPLTIAKTLTSEFDITDDMNLNNLEKEFLKGIYPNILPKGYEIVNNKLIPTRYSGI